MRKVSALDPFPFHLTLLTHTIDYSPQPFASRAPHDSPPGRIESWLSLLRSSKLDDVRHHGLTSGGDGPPWPSPGPCKNQNKGSLGTLKGARHPFKLGDLGASAKIWTYTFHVKGWHLRLEGVFNLGVGVDIVKVNDVFLFFVFYFIIFSPLETGFESIFSNGIYYWGFYLWLPCSDSLWFLMLRVNFSMPIFPFIVFFSLQ